MGGGATEERTTRGGPLDEEMAVVLPGEADATEGLDRFAPDEALAVVGSSLGHGDGGGAVRRVLVDGGDGEIAEGTGPLDGEEHVAHFVLDRLEGADGDAELLALLDVGQQQLEEGVAGADRLEGQPDRRLLQGAGDAAGGRRAAGLAQGAVLRDEENLPFVYLMQPDGSFARLHLTLGNRSGDRYDIPNGLRPGERIVADGAIFVQFMQNQ